ncbi:hypothetical protein HYW32_03905 [Candidatus Berkelbacteria bacterium]|nr:hypothetical protein [Candidatus Berkelbacteria bacterium]
MIPITIIDELLVLLDDNVTRTLDECAFSIPQRTRQTLSSTLGRLTSKGWVKTERDRLRRINIYSITQAGQEQITKTLSHIKLIDDTNWKDEWLFVIFNIPEKHRHKRDVLRNRLSNLGFGRVQNSLWVTARDIRFEFDDLLDLAHIKGRVIVLQPKLTPEESQKLVNSFEWNWQELNAAYHLFIEEADRYLRRTEHPALEARLLVFRYAKLLSQDPKFPSHLEPSDHQRDRAHDRYAKLRPYCYKEG